MFDVPCSIDGPISASIHQATDMQASGCRPHTAVFSSIIDVLWQTGIAWAQAKARRLFATAVEYAPPPHALPSECLSTARTRDRFERGVEINQTSCCGPLTSPKTGGRVRGSHPKSKTYILCTSILALWRNIN